MAYQATFDPTTGPRTARLGDRLASAGAFAGAARRYWTGVYPRVARELEHWRKRAAEIPDPVLRALALDAWRKRENPEGAAAFAAFVPHANRAAVVRAAVAFQSAYDYLDVLAEQPQADPVAGARGLHEALLDSLDPSLGSESKPDPGMPRPDYYARYPWREDGGYLAELARTCRTALATLPSYAALAPAARRAAERIVEFQSLNLSELQGEHDALARWACTETPAGSDLRWWETAGAGGSPLCVYALIAAASDPTVRTGAAQAIEHAYFPWIGALHSLLDHLVDHAQDTASAQRNLIDYYSSPREAADRMRRLAELAADAARGLPRGRAHTIVLAGMTGYYLSLTEASAPAAAPIAQHVRAAIGGSIAPALLVFKARGLVDRVAGSSRSESAPTIASSRTPALPVAPAARTREVMRSA
jgi:tetraprenyl-beta-curcumene synthase